MKNEKKKIILADNGTIGGLFFNLVVANGVAFQNCPKNVGHNITCIFSYDRNIICSL